MDEVKALQEIMDTGMYTPVFKENPKYRRGFCCYFIKYDDVMDHKYIISGTDEVPTYTTEGTLVVEYGSAEELFADGWHLD